MYQIYKQRLKELFEKHRVAVSFILALFIIFVGGFLLVQGARANDKENKTITSSEIVESNQSTSEQEVKKEEVVFDIEGAVANPGVYRLPVESVLADAIKTAGGLNIEADKDRIARELNQASPIGNNSKIYIFKNSDKDIKVVSNGTGQASMSGSSSSSSSSQQVSGKININTANLTELDTLPGIGPALGQRIIDWRDANGGYEVPEDLKKVKGIGDSVYEGLKSQITVE